MTNRYLVHENATKRGEKLKNVNYVNILIEYY